MYYRILIPELFYHYNKVLYLDCDIIINRDVAQLYEVDLGNAPIGAVHNVLNYSMYRYVTNMLKLSAETYFNSGILLINNNNFIEQQVKNKCFDLLKIKQNLVCPDQDLLNLACKDNIFLMDSGWNFQWHSCLPGAEKIVEQSEISLLNAKQKKYIIHYTSGKKAWMYPENEYSVDFWSYAESSSYRQLICQIGLSKRMNATVYEALRAELKKPLQENSTKKELDAIKSSFSFKLGRFLTWLPRKIYALFRCIHEHGLRYTFLRIFFGKAKANNYEIKKRQKHDKS